MAIILVVDDDDLVRRATTRLLRSMGHDVEEAPNGRVALQKYDERQPDVVLMDIFMPDADGLETTRALRTSWPDALIIGMTGGGLLHMDLALTVAAELGAKGALRKPFTANELKDAVDASLVARAEAAT